MKIAICIPCHGDTKALFTFSLARLIAFTLRERADIEIETLIARSSILVQSRTRLIEWSRDWGAEHILWLDSDHTFPPQTLLRLLAHNLPAVGANYPRRHTARTPSAVRRRGPDEWQLVISTKRKVAELPVEPVDRIGFGILLIAVEPMLAALGDPLYPLFETQSRADGSFVGEDSLFCDRLRRGGLAIHVDHGLSMTVGHITEETLFFPQD